MLSRKTISLAFLLVALATASACSPGKTTETATGSSQPSELSISAALGLKEALLEIQQDYETSHPGVKLVYNLAAAGQLESQIEQGAPVDVFLSAANKQIDMLAQKDLIDKSTRKALVKNTLVLIVPKQSSLELNQFNDLTNPAVTHFGLGEPESVPAGQYGKQVLQKAGIWETVKDKAVITKDVRAILSYVETGNTDAGIVFSTVAALSDKVKIAATAPPGSHEPIIFPGVVLKNAKQPELAKEFLDYLAGPAGMNIFQKYGFQPAEKE